MLIDLQLPEIPTIVPLQVKIPAKIAADIKQLAEKKGLTVSKLTAHVYLSVLKAEREERSKNAD